MAKVWSVSELIALQNKSKQINLVNTDFKSVKKDIANFMIKESNGLFNQFDMGIDQYGNNITGSNLGYFLDAMTYATVYLGRYLNMVVNENFIDSVTQRKNVISMCKYLNYEPYRVKPAVAKIKITLNKEAQQRLNTIYYPKSSNPSFILPKGSYFIGKETGLPFITVKDVIFNKNVDQSKWVNYNDYNFDSANWNNYVYNYTAEVGLIQAELREKTWTSDGKANQAFKIFDTNIVSSDFIYKFDENDEPMSFFGVYVNDNAWQTQKEWQENIILTGDFDVVKYIQEAKIYFFNEYANFFKLAFGDNQIKGAIPENGSQIKLTYLISEGSDGNEEKEFSYNEKQLVYRKGENEYFYDNGFMEIEITHEYDSSLKQYVSGKSTGGKDEESLESIRINAPLNYSIRNTAVTINDFIILTRKEANGKATAWSGVDEIPIKNGYVILTSLATLEPSKEKLNSTNVQYLLNVIRMKSNASIRLDYFQPIFVSFILDAKLQVDVNDSSSNNVPELDALTLTQDYFKEKYDFNASFNYNKLVYQLNEINRVLGAEMDFETYIDLTLFNIKDNSTKTYIINTSDDYNSYIDDNFYYMYFPRIQTNSVDSNGDPYKDGFVLSIDYEGIEKRVLYSRLIIDEYGNEKNLIFTEIDFYPQGFSDGTVVTNSEGHKSVGEILLEDNETVSEIQFYCDFDKIKELLSITEITGKINFTFFYKNFTFLRNFVCILDDASTFTRL